MSACYIPSPGHSFLGLCLPVVNLGLRTVLFLILSAGRPCSFEEKESLWREIYHGVAVPSLGETLHSPFAHPCSNRSMLTCVSSWSTAVQAIGIIPGSCRQSALDRSPSHRPIDIRLKVFRLHRCCPRSCCAGVIEHVGSFFCHITNWLEITTLALSCVSLS